MKRVMIDIETLDIAPTAVVFEIAAVEFDSLGNIGKKFQAVLSIPHQISLGRTKSEDTIRFWESQPDEAKKALRAAEVTNDLHVPLDDFWFFLADLNAREYWCKGTSFDFPILENLLLQTGNRIPWGYGQKRDLRTLLRIAELDEKQVPRDSGYVHSALGDCLFQIKCWVLAMENLYPTPPAVYADYG